jgi:chromate transporter
MTGILLPSFLLILGLAYVYTTYDKIPAINQFFMGVLPAVSAIIVSVALNMARKQIADYKQVVVCVSAGILLLLVRSYFATLGVIAVAGLAGYFLYNRKGEEPERKPVEQPAFSVLRTGILVAIPVALILIIYLVSPVFAAEGTILRQMALTFSGLSVTLFGGGYVIIPAMQQVLVDSLHWLTVQEFADAIAMGQITPGPIFIRATFIGYKMAGIAGAIVGTIAIFFPPGFIMVFCSRFLDRIRKSAAVVAAFKGMRPAIIGMIFSAAVTIVKGMDPSLQAGLIFILILLLTIKFKVNVVYLIPASGLTGILSF